MDKLRNNIRRFLMWRIKSTTGLIYGCYESLVEAEREASRLKVTMGIDFFIEPVSDYPKHRPMKRSNLYP